MARVRPFRASFPLFQTEQAPASVAAIHPDYPERVLTAREEWPTFHSPAYYIHRQQFQYQGRRYERKAILAMVKADEHLIPHEDTLPQQVQDISQSILKNSAHDFPVFLLYQDPQAQVAQVLQSVENTSPLLHRHSGTQSESLYAIQSPERQQALSQFLNQQRFLIADGHHRYQAAKRLQGKRYPEAAGYVCGYLCEIQDPGLLLRSHHRHLRQQTLSDKLIQALQQAYLCQQIAPADVAQALQTENSLCVLQSQRVCWQIQTRAPLQRLKVIEVHQAILEAHLGLCPADFRDLNQLRYADHIEELQETLYAEGGLAVYLPPPDLQRLCQEAQNGLTLPPKSTSFFPKVPHALLSARLQLAFTDSQGA